MDAICGPARPSAATCRLTVRPKRRHRRPAIGRYVRIFTWSTGHACVPGGSGPCRYAAPAAIAVPGLTWGPQQRSGCRDTVAWLTVRDRPGEKALPVGPATREETRGGGTSRPRNLSTLRPGVIGCRRGHSASTACLCVSLRVHRVYGRHRGNRVRCDEGHGAADSPVLRIVHGRRVHPRETVTGYYAFAA
jgi:hypothetical protein